MKLWGWLVVAFAAFVIVVMAVTSLMSIADRPNPDRTNEMKQITLCIEQGGHPFYTADKFGDIGLYFGCVLPPG